MVEAKKLTLGPQNVLSQAERYSRGVIESPFDFGSFRFRFSTPLMAKSFGITTSATI